MSDVQLTTLPSGLRVVTERMPGALSVAAGVWVGVGARDEPDELAGVSHFLEHLLFKGTEDRSARDIATAIDRVGGDMNAFTTKEYTAYYTRLPADGLALGLEILGDVLTAPRSAMPTSTARGKSSWRSCISTRTPTTTGCTPWLRPRCSLTTLSGARPRARPRP